jgi:hypothetical protein
LALYPRLCAALVFVFGFWAVAGLSPVVRSATCLPQRLYAGSQGRLRSTRGNTGFALRATGLNPYRSPLGPESPSKWSCIPNQKQSEIQIFLVWT